MLAKNRNAAALICILCNGSLPCDIPICRLYLCTDLCNCLLFHLERICIVSFAFCRYKPLLLHPLFPVIFFIIIDIWHSIHIINGYRKPAAPLKIDLIFLFLQPGEWIILLVCSFIVGLIAALNKMITLYMKRKHGCIQNYQQE